MDCCSWRGASGSVFPITMAISQRGSPAPVDHHLRPFTTYSSPLLSMRALMFVASEDATSGCITFKADGTAHVASATSDIGPGTYTVITMIAAEYLGLRPEQVKFELGDTGLPRAPAQGGSWTTASVGSAVHGAALAVTAKLLALANREGSSPLKTATAADVEMLDGRLRLKADASKFVNVSDVMRRN